MHQHKDKPLWLQIISLIAMWSLLAATVWVTDGCQKKATTANPNPTTPFQQVLLWNTGLAQSNQDIAKTVMGLEAQHLISTDAAHAILTLQYKIAAADKKLTGILEEGPQYVSGHASEVNGLLDDIAMSANDLIVNGLAGVQDVQKRQSIATAISSVVGLGKLIVTGLQAAGVLQAGDARYMREVWA